MDIPLGLYRNVSVFSSFYKKSAIGSGMGQAQQNILTFQKKKSKIN